MIYIYVWGNNPRRAELKGRECVLEATGARCSALVRFLDTGERVLTSRRALLCEQQACVNPDHLTLLTKSQHTGLHKQKFTDEEVEAIRNDPRPLREIIAAYGISQSHASDIRGGRVRAA